MNEIFGGTNGERIAKYLMAALLLLTAFLTVEVLQGLKKFGYIGKEIYPQRTIMVYGTGEAFAIPDIATFSFSVVETAKTVAEAQKIADTKMAAALKVLKDRGIDDKDIKTTNYSFYPKYEWNQVVCSELNYPNCPSGRNVLIGYEVNQTILVKVRDTDKAGDLVTKIGATGASNVSGVEFTVDDKDKYKTMAREEAIKEAKANAQKLAKDLGVKLGKMLYFNEDGNYPIPYYAEGKGGGDMTASSIAPARAELPVGESKINSNVNITYEIR